jgi:hypothetical protein
VDRSSIDQFGHMLDHPGKTSPCVKTTENDRNVQGDTMSATAISSPTTSAEPLRRCSAICTLTSAVHANASPTPSGHDHR